MANDRLYHKRKARTAASLKRKRAKRSPYDMVLIVCEGEKTEPNYFRALIDDLQLNTANIVIAKNTAGLTVNPSLLHLLTSSKTRSPPFFNQSQVSFPT